MKCDLRRGILVVLFLSTAITACGGGGGGSGTPNEFVAHDVEVGDPTVSYANVEFTEDSRYMVWLEGTNDGSGLGVVWHCAVDPDTGALNPPDGKGFRAFESTLLGRANSGLDAQGSYYVGLNRGGELVMVRPMGATTGTVTVLATAADSLRRAIYPTVLPGEARGYVLWIRNEQVAASGADPRNAWFELQYIDLANPTAINVVERQNNPPGPLMAPIDIGFVRWMRGRSTMTYGYFDASYQVQLRELDVSVASPAVRAITSDAVNKIDPFSWLFGSQEVILAGIDGTATSHVYTRASGEQYYTVAEVIVPSSTLLASPALAQSHEPVEWGGQAYSAFQINDAGSSFWNTAFASPGEIHLTTVLQSSQRQWRLSGNSELARAEPEPYVGTNRVWVFYSAAPVGADLTTTRWALRRADTPMHTP